MRKLVLSAVLLSTLASPVLAQATLQLTPQGVQVVDPRLQNDARDAQRDATRDAQRDQQRDLQHDQQQRDARDQRRDDNANYRDDQQRRDEQARTDEQRRRDEQQRYADNRDGNNGNHNGWNNDRHDERQVYGYNGRDNQRDWRYDGQRYQTGSYYHPRGYNYRAYATGSYLPKSYWQAQRYWIGNPTAYRLSPTWSGVRWVRVGSDALLIRTKNGAIVSVVRGLFY